jgi:hypothetical protein
MRQVLAVVVVMVVSGCTKSNDIPPIIDPSSGVCTGDVTISSSAEMDAFIARGCMSVTGTLSIVGTDLSSVSLPALKAVGTAIPPIHGSVTIDLTPLAGGCRHPVNFGPEPWWTALAICSNANLASIDLPALETSHSLAVMGNSALVALRLPTLKTVFGEGGMFGGGFPGTYYGGLGIASNPVLTSIALPALTSIGMLAIEDNAAYPQCAAEAILAQLTLTPWQSTPGNEWWASISGNDTTATCLPVVCTGDVTITSSAEMDAFIARGCTSVTGTLSIKGTDLYSVNLTGLTSVNSLEVLDNTSLVRVNLSALSSVRAPLGCYRGGDMIGLVCGGGLSIYGNPSLISVSAPALASAGGLAIHHNDTLTNLNSPALVTVSSAPSYDGPNVFISGCPALTTFSLPALTTVGGGGLVLWGMTTIDLPALTTVPGFLSVGYSPLLTNFSLPSLTAIGGVEVSYNSGLASFSLPALTTVGGDLSIAYNALLTGFDLPGITTIVGGLYVRGNTAYPQCAAEGILAQLTAPPATVDISGNDTTATCPP